MKLLLTSSFLLLTFLSNLANAAQPSGKESLIFTSNPHPCMNGCEKEDDRDTRFKNIDEQYRWINNYKASGKNVAGVIINGNLTESGGKDDFIAINKKFTTLKVPYLFGLGGNDYIYNKESCSECAVRGVWYLNRHVVEKMVKKTKPEPVYDHIGNVHFDFTQSVTGLVDGQMKTNGEGGLGYAVELGKQKNIYLIQLNGNVGTNKLEIVGRDGAFGISDSHYSINPVVGWLENRLEYAAQFQPPKTIVVTMNGANVDPSIVALLDKYQITLRFLGNDGSSANCKKNSDLADDSKFYCLGFSTKRELLELELDFDRRAFDIIHHTVGPNNSKPIRKAVDFYPTTPKYATGTYPGKVK